MQNHLLLALQLVIRELNFIMALSPFPNTVRTRVRLAALLCILLR